ncbi:MAG: pilus assembly protein PilM [Candidatus Omnitrophica bacterium]|nr:pilus assembly protein PilM [Candidatus Omnitrophota bacterium]
MRHIVAVDAGSCYVKVIEGSERGGRLFIKKIGYFPNPFSDFRSSLVEREQDVFVKSLKKFLHDGGIREKRAVSGISGDGAVIHYFDIPKLPESEVKSAVQLELMQVTPGGAKNMEYDYLLLPGKEGGRTVLFAGYQKDKCDFFTAALHRAGLRPLILDHDALAVFNSFSFLNKKQGGVVFILNIGHKTSNFILSEKGGFALIRDIPFGGRNLTGVVAAGKHISQEEAEIYSNKEENREDVQKILAEGIEELLMEMQASIEYFRAKTGKSPERLFLTGGASVFPGLLETVGQNVKIDAALWNPLENLSEVKTYSLPEEIKKKGIMFAVCLGLVLRKIK